MVKVRVMARVETMVTIIAVINNAITVDTYSIALTNLIFAKATDTLGSVVINTRSFDGESWLEILQVTLRQSLVTSYLDTTAKVAINRYRLAYIIPEFSLLRANLLKKGLLKEEASVAGKKVIVETQGSKSILLVLKSEDTFFAPQIAPTIHTNPATTLN